MRIHFALLALLAACASAPRAESPRPNLAGTWLLDRNESNDSSVFAPLRVYNDTMRQLPPEHPIHGARRAFDALRDAPPRLHLATTGDGVQLGCREEHDVALRTDGSEQQLHWCDGEVWRVKTRWMNGRLEVKRRRDDIPEITDYYSRSAATNVLVVWSVIMINDEQTSVRRVYTQAS